MEEEHTPVSIPPTLMILDGIGLLLIISGAMEMAGYIQVFSQWVS